MNGKYNRITVFKVKNINELVEVAQKLALFFKKNTCLLLDGEMGAGKTTFTKIFLKELGVKEVVTSPTFVIMNQYFSNEIKINHIDAYRLNQNEEFEMYLDEMIDSFNVIEWSQNLNINLKSYFEIITVKIKIFSDECREFLIEEGG
ncbi:tRNA (adenosine(37)-N6)-threonylcarbamoyltransferase complex ATPase subunit type 1 TsaE [Spiroplasma taiwanense]|uniref:tRNA threonylcarbamoyladenosine biosynthesis protein TsaE n=1 Tax=Spiroplasma taiwanense CT-1 TaxID=1276220 RepID=S5LYV7_9MOLU|nr:tRNA (adenosine(37)-N6)-threonylcarbamoyltransferase complex ATPase subunit type 1 TsaE [Spiroplasma taiwanense]AGR40872.1 hypothetical protein STAIW_v1c01950 [Spiroplasma taiwanense CT-1]